MNVRSLCRVSLIVAIFILAVNSAQSKKTERSVSLLEHNEQADGWKTFFRGAANTQSRTAKSSHKSMNENACLWCKRETAVLRFRDNSSNDPEVVASMDREAKHERGSTEMRVTRVTRDTDSNDPTYVYSVNGIKISNQEYNLMSTEMKQILTRSMIARSSQVGAIGRSGLSLTVPSSSLVYEEDSDPLSLLPNPANLATDDEVEYITVVLINNLDGDDEILSLDNFTVSGTVDVGGRNVSFHYDVTPDYTYANNILNVSGLANREEYEKALNTLRYQNVAEEPTATLRGVRITVHDSTSTTSANIFFSVTQINDSPRFTSQPPNVTIQEGGTLYAPISSTSITLLGDSVFDPDFGAQKAVAVLGADNSHGRWVYGDSSGSHTIMDGVRDANGNILRNTSLSQTSVVLSGQYIGFIPDEDFYGTSSITLVAWDKTGTSSSLSHGTYANVTWSEKGDPFGSDMATVTVIVVPSNDAPRVNLTLSLWQLGSIEENSQGGDGIYVAKLTEACYDVDLPYDDTKLNIGVAITEVDDDNGSWQFTTDNGTSWNALNSASVLLGDNGDEYSYRIRFIPNEYFYGEVNITYKCWDFTSGDSGDVGVDASYSGSDGAFSEDEVKGILFVNNINDRPYFLSNLSSIPLPVYSDSPSYNQRGTTLEHLLSSAIKDNDPTDLPGLAVVGLEEDGSGDFEYTCDVIEDSSNTSSTARWYSFYSAHGPGFTSYEKPSLSRATLLSSNCSIRFKPTDSFSSSSTSYIEVIAWDGSNGIEAGNFEANVTADSDTSYGNETISIRPTISYVSSRPIIAGDQGILHFTEDDPALAIFQDITITDMTLGSSASVTITNAVDIGYEKLEIGSVFGFSSEEELKSSTGLDVTWSNNLTSVTFTGAVGVISYMTSLRSVTYVHISNNPTASSERLLKAEVTDSIGITSLPAYRNLTLVPLNDAPSLDVSAPTDSSWKIVEFRRGSGGVELLQQDVTFSFIDPDQSVPSALVVTIEMAYDGSLERLNIANSIQRRVNISNTLYHVETISVTSFYDVLTSSLTFSLSGSSLTADDYNTALHHVTYTNTADPPDFRHRTVRLYATDAYGVETNMINVSIDVVESDGSSVVPLPDDNRPGAPLLSGVVANPYTTTQFPTSQAEVIDTDSKISSGDTIHITFDRDTNMAPFGYYDVTDPVASGGKMLSKSEVDELFVFDTPLVLDNTLTDGYTGRWISSSVFEVTIMREGYPQVSAKIGEWTVSLRYRPECYNAPSSVDLTQRYCIRDITRLSNVSFSSSPPLTGSWGLNVPDVFATVTRNDAANARVSITQGTTYLVALRPALSKNQLDLICAISFATLFGSNFTASFPGLVGTLTSCNNEFVREWDLSLDKTDQIPTVSLLTIDFQTSSSSYQASAVSSYMEANFDRIAVAGVVMSDTGVPIASMQTYMESKSRIVSSILMEKDPALTPQLSSYSIARASVSNIISSDLTIKTGDIVTLAFNRATNTPAASSASDVRKIMTFDQLSLNGSTGQWINSSTLVITLGNIDAGIEQLTFTFAENRFADGNVVPDDFTDRPYCIGVGVCGSDDSSTGICDATSESCRLSGSFLLQHDTTSTVTSSSSLVDGGVDGIDWWWLLLLGIFLLVAGLVIAWLAWKVKRQSKSDDKIVKKKFENDYKSISPDTTETNVSKTPPSSRSSSQRFLFETSSRSREDEADKVKPINRVRPFPSRGSSRISPMEKTIFTISESAFEGGNALNDYQRKVRFAPSPATPIIANRSPSFPRTASASSYVTMPDFDSEIALQSLFEEPGNSEESETYLPSTNQGILSMRNRMVYGGDVVPMEPGSINSHQSPLPRPSSVRFKWKETVAMVTDRYLNFNADEEPVDQTNDVTIKRSRNISVGEGSNELGDLTKSLPFDEGCSDSGYFPSFSSGSERSLRCSSGKLSTVSTVVDLSSARRSDESQQSHRPSISGLPLSWYVMSSSPTEEEL